MKLALRPDDLDRDDSHVLWFASQCASNQVRLESLIKSAERAGDTPLADFFRRALGARERYQDSAQAA